MKKTSVIRKVDELGRVVLPIDLRRNLGIEITGALEIFMDGNKIVLTKHMASDIFTGSTEDLVEYKGKKVSIQSIKEMAKIAGIY